MRVLRPAAPRVRRRSVRPPPELPVAGQRARVAQCDRGFASAVRRRRDHRGQAAGRDRSRDAFDGTHHATAGAGHARARHGRFVEDGGGGVHSPRAGASRGQSDAGGEPARDRQEHALRKNPQVRPARRGQRRAQAWRGVTDAARGAAHRPPAAATAGIT
nr:MULTISPECIES: hypothetical protein [Burkholderia cepacia complex]